MNQLYAPSVTISLSSARTGIQCKVVNIFAINVVVSHFDDVTAFRMKTLFFLAFPSYSHFYKKTYERVSKGDMKSIFEAKLERLIISRSQVRVLLDPPFFSPQNTYKSLTLQ